MTKRNYTTTPETDAALQAGLDDHNARLGEDNPGLISDTDGFFSHLVDSQMNQIVAQYGKTVNADANTVEAALANADPEVQAAFAKLRAAALA